jgi:hypothetical protein
VNRIGFLVLLALCPGAGAVAGEAMPDAATPALRDPTQPPLAARPAASSPMAGAVNANAAGPDAGTAPRHVMVLQGRPYVIERGWRRGVGDKLGDARIERIEPTAIWLRDASGTHKVSLYPGVELRPALAASAPAVAHAAKKTQARERAPRPAASATLATKDPLP